MDGALTMFRNLGAKPLLFPGHTEDKIKICCSEPQPTKLLSNLIKMMIEKYSEMDRLESS